jgi:hypothetical protein
MQQIIKSRDDVDPIFLINEKDSKFRLKEGCNCTWINNDNEIDVTKIRPRIEPWLTALFQSDHLSLLIGSGLTHAMYKLGTGDSLPGMNTAKFAIFNEQIEHESIISAKKSGRETPNIEDQIRVANELLVGLQHYCSNDLKVYGAKKLIKETDKLNKELERIMKEFAQSILKGENGLATSEKDKRENAFIYLVNFLMSFASRSGTRDRLKIFTTNYDRIIETGAELAGLFLMDRFIGNIFPILRSSRLDIDMHYNPPGIRGEPRYLEGVAHFTKLHGSVDWINVGRDIRRFGLPFGAMDIVSFLNAPGLIGANVLQLMIYPNSVKDRETAAYPYVELFRDFAAAICRPNHTLVTYGYSFGDEHINRVIEDMLTIPSTHLVIISRDDNSGRIMNAYKMRPAQCTLMIGDNLGDLTTLVDNYMPKPAIDRTTFRMADLLKMRLGTANDDNKDNEFKKGLAEEKE